MSRGAILSALLALAVPADAAPKAAPRPGWVYDRLAFNPAGDSLTVVAWLDGPGSAAGGARFDVASPSRRLIIDVAGRRVVVDPEVRTFRASPDRAHLLLLGERGLWWHDLGSGQTAQLYFQSPDGGARVVDYAFRRDGTGAVFLTGAPGDPAGGLFRFVPPARVERLADHRPGEAPPPAWTDEAFPHDIPPVTATRSARRFSVPGTPPLRFDYDGHTLLVEPGTAAERVALPDVTIEWASWPSGGEYALVALREGTGRPRLLAVGAGRPLRFPLEDQETPSVAWLDDRTALVSGHAGHLYRYDADADTMAVFPLGQPPAWARLEVPEEVVATLRVNRWPRSARRFEQQQALLGKAARELPEAGRGAALAHGRRLGGAGVQLVGVYPSLEAAEAAAPAFRRLGIDLEPLTCPALEMSGQFDYGECVNARGDRAWIRRLSDSGGSEIWWHPSGGAPERLLTREMTP